MGLDDIEWYEAPTSDEEVLELYFRNHQRPTRQDRQWHQQRQQQLYAQQNPTRFKTWGLLRRFLWFCCWPFALVWAAVVGLIAMIMCVTVVLAPFGVALMIVAGWPL